MHIGFLPRKNRDTAASRRWTMIWTPTWDEKARKRRCPTSEKLADEEENSG